MKLSIFAAAISITTAAATMCWTNSVIEATTATSPLITDCQALADDPTILPDIWIPTQESSSFDISHGTCGFRGVYNMSSTFPADQMTITRGLVSTTISHAVIHKAVDGKVGANGQIACLIPGYKVQTGWIKWEIYKVTSCQRKRNARLSARRAAE